MTIEQQLREFRSGLAAGRLADNDKTLAYEFRRGWNEGIEFAQNQADKHFGKAEKENGNES